MDWLLQLKLWALQIQLKNKETRILHLENLLVRQVLTDISFDSSPPLRILGGS